MRALQRWPSQSLIACASALSELRWLTKIAVIGSDSSSTGEASRRRGYARTCAPAVTEGAQSLHSVPGACASGSVIGSQAIAGWQSPRWTLLRATQ